LQLIVQQSVAVITYSYIVPPVHTTEYRMHRNT